MQRRKSILALEILSIAAFFYAYMHGKVVFFFKIILL